MPNVTRTRTTLDRLGGWATANRPVVNWANVPVRSFARSTS